MCTGVPCIILSFLMHLRRYRNPLPTRNGTKTASEFRSQPNLRERMKRDKAIETRYISRIPYCSKYIHTLVQRLSGLMLIGRDTRSRISRRPTYQRFAGSQQHASNCLASTKHSSWLTLACFMSLYLPNMSALTCCLYYVPVMFSPSAGSLHCKRIGICSLWSSTDVDKGTSPSEAFIALKI